MMGPITPDGRCRKRVWVCSKKWKKPSQALWLFAPCPQSSSRTDTGVHALGMVADVEIPAANSKFRPANWRWP